MMLIDFIYL